MASKLDSLKRLKSLGYEVPEFTGINEEQVRSHLAENRLLKGLESSLAGLQAADCKETLNRMQEDILQAAESSVTSGIREKAKHLGDMIVRSDFAMEDSKKASFAGVFRSVGPVRPEGMTLAVNQVIASAFSETHYAYARKMGLPFCPLRMEIIIQKYIKPLYNPVVFTSYQYSCIGLIETGNRTIIYGKEEEERRSTKVQDRLIGIANRLEPEFGRPQDVEFVVDKDRNIHLVQSRPITQNIKEGYEVSQINKNYVPVFIRNLEEVKLRIKSLGAWVPLMPFKGKMLIKNLKEYNRIPDYFLAESDELDVFISNCNSYLSCLKKEKDTLEVIEFLTIKILDWVVTHIASNLFKDISLRYKISHIDMFRLTYALGETDKESALNMVIRSVHNKNRSKAYALCRDTSFKERLFSRVENHKVEASRVLQDNLDTIAPDYQKRFLDSISRLRRLHEILIWTEQMIMKGRPQGIPRTYKKIKDQKDKIGSKSFSTSIPFNINEVITGRVKKVFDKHSAFQVRGEDIIVVVDLHSDVLGPLCESRAFITERKFGSVSHAAIIAQEIGASGIIGLKGALEMFCDGDLIRLGTDGSVAVLQKGTNSSSPNISRY